MAFSFIFASWAAALEVRIAGNTTTHQLTKHRFGQQDVEIQILLLEGVAPQHFYIGLSETEKAPSCDSELLVQLYPGETKVTLFDVTYNVFVIKCGQYTEKGGSSLMGVQLRNSRGHLMSFQKDLCWQSALALLVAVLLFIINYRDYRREKKYLEEEKIETVTLSPIMTVGSGLLALGFTLYAGQQFRAALGGAESVFWVWVASVVILIPRVLLSVLFILVAIGWQLTYVEEQTRKEEKEFDSFLNMLGTLGFAEILANSLDRCTFFPFANLYSLTGYAGVASLLLRLALLAFFCVFFFSVAMKIKGGKTLFPFVLDLGMIGMLYFSAVAVGWVGAYAFEHSNHLRFMETVQWAAELGATAWWTFQNTHPSSKFWVVREEMMEYEDEEEAPAQN